MEIATWVFTAFFGWILYRLFQFARADADLTLLGSSIRPNHFSGEVVWIVGASYGIGEHLAMEFAKYGANLVLSARSVDKLGNVAKNCIEHAKKHGASIQVQIVPLDLLKTDTHKACVDQILTKFGKIDIVVNNGARSQRGIIERTPLQVDREIFELNVMGTFSITKAVLPTLIEKKKGHIVAISSVAGKMGAPVSGSYSATKHALQGFFNTLRYEVADRNITVTSVCPGPVVSMNSELAFTDTPGQHYGTKPGINDGKMSTERCAELTVIGVANKLEEIWLAQHPILLFVYISQYFPTLSFYLGKKVGQTRVKQFLSGDGNINSGLLSSMWKKTQ